MEILEQCVNMIKVNDKDTITTRSELAKKCSFAKKSERSEEKARRRLKFFGLLRSVLLNLRREFIEFAIVIYFI